MHTLNPLYLLNPLNPDFHMPLLIADADWLALTMVAVSIVLAMTAASMLFFRPRSAPGDTSDQPPARYMDPVLLVSAAIVIGLGIVIWLLR